MKEFEWFEWFEWFGPSPIEPFNSGYGYVDYEHKDEADAALRSMQGGQIDGNVAESGRLRPSGAAS